ncbi:hypothetical protein Tco_1273598 [Tanacetum coccineum]
MIRETTEKIVQIKNHLLTARSRQKSYTDRRSKPLEFEVGNMVPFKVSTWKGAVHFGKQGKLSPRYIRPFKILARVGPVAYTLELPEELKGIHSTFHVLNLEKCLAEDYYSEDQYAVSIKKDTAYPCLHSPKTMKERRSIRRIQKKSICRIEDIVKMDDPNITMEEYISLEEEKARRHGKVYNWETTTYGKIWDNEDVHGLGSVKSEFPAIVFNDTLTSEVALSCEPTPMVSYFDDLDYFKDFDNEFLTIVYNDALTSKSNFSTEPVVIPQHIDEFNLEDETSLSECDEKEQNVLYFNDLFPFNVMYPDDSKSDTDNDDDKIDFKQSSGGINTYPGYGYGVSTSCTVLGPRERKLMNIGRVFTNLEILKC